MFANATSDQLAQIQDILQSLDRSKASDSTPNRRSKERVRIRSAMNAVLLGPSEMPSLTIFSRNISCSGLGFVSRRSFKADERLAISFQVPGEPPKLVLTQVTFCRYVRAGVHEVGAQFLQCVPDTRGPDRIPASWLASTPAPKPPAARGRA